MDEEHLPEVIGAEVGRGRFRSPQSLCSRERGKSFLENSRSNFRLDRLLGHAVGPSFGARPAQERGHCCIILGTISGPVPPVAAIPGQ